MALTLAKTLRLLAAEKKAVLQRQAALVTNLNKLLPTIGYRVVPLEAEGRMDLRRPLGRRARPARKPLGVRPLVCSYCNRTFALPLHLGRHVSVMHRAKSASSAPAPSPVVDTRPAGKGAKPTRKSRARATGMAARRRRVRSRRVAAKKAPRPASTVKRGKG